VVPPSKGRRRGAFYSKFLEANEASAPKDVDLSQIRARLAEEMRRHPGERQFLLQVSRVLLRAEAMELRMSGTAKERLRKSFLETLAHLEGQLMPHHELPPAERISELRSSQEN
jgi:hypothetical protein